MSREQGPNHVNESEGLAQAEPSVVAPHLGGIAMDGVQPHIRHNSFMPPSGFDMPQVAGRFALHEGTLQEAHVEVNDQPPAEGEPADAMVDILPPEQSGEPAGPPRFE